MIPGELADAVAWFRAAASLPGHNPEQRQLWAEGHQIAIRLVAEIRLMARVIDAGRNALVGGRQEQERFARLLEQYDGR